NNEFKKAAQASRPDHNRLWDLDERFHNLTVEVAGGPRLQLLHGSVKPQAERYERLYVSYLTGEIATSVAEHKAIVSAIAAGDGDAAKEAVEINWRNAADRLGRVIERVGDRGRW
ncbi:MAG: FCD domain-containing protein, partial [Gemmatimonadales bacterium]